MVYSPLIFLVQVIALYIFSRAVVKQLYSFFDIFIKSQKLVFIMVSILYFPGTIIHEMSHFFAAIILFLNVKDIRIFPEFENDHIRLGSVSFEKKDFIRGILVGVAPIIFAMLIFFIIAANSLYPTNSLGLNILFGYLIFTISSTMFSSKKDIVDLIYVIPLAIILIGVIIYLGINVLDLFKSDFITKLTISFFEKVNFYLFFSLIINIVLLGVLKVVVFLFKRGK